MSVTDQSFNPPGKAEVDLIKKKLTELEEAILTLPAGRRRSVALTQLELAGMMAVKAAVVGDN